MAAGARISRCCGRCGFSRVEPRWNQPVRKYKTGFRFQCRDLGRRAAAAALLLGLRRCRDGVRYLQRNRRAGGCGP